MTALLATVRADVMSTVDHKRIDPRRFWLHVVGKVVLNPRVRAVLLFRMAHVLATHRLTPFALLLRGRALHTSGAEIHPTAQIGPGFCLVHSSGVVIGGEVVIGRDCRLHQGVTLGEAGRGSTRGSGEPSLGDHVTVGAHAVIMGPVTVGDRAVIAANSVVTIDVPADAVVGGIPGRVIRINDFDVTA